ncbi:MAG: hypothetical protein FWC78_07980 [Defluviitaleaceae bacterium]|nr:hypothetical protein [Defluviitaleaceae bacterium]
MKIKILIIIVLIAVVVFLAAANFGRPPAVLEFGGTFVNLDVNFCGYLYQA